MLSRRTFAGGALAAAATAGVPRRGAAAPRVVTDAAGRTVAIPPRVERVFAAGPPAAILVYALAPDLLLDGRAS